MRRSSRGKLKDRVFLRMAFDLSELGTCSRRKVGAIFIDSKHRIVASGYNGPAPDEPHCIDHPCKGAHCKSGEGLELCEAIHAEQNGLIQCKFPDEIHTVYCTDSPCMHCVKLLAVTGAQRIVFAREYPHSASKAYWEGLGRRWEHLPILPSTFWRTNPTKSVSEAFGVLFRSLKTWLIGE